MIATTPAVHYHVHSHLGGGYLCECDSHYPIIGLAARDRAMLEEVSTWRDYAAEVNADPTMRGVSHIVVRGRARDGYMIDDTRSIAWARYVDWFECSEPECFEPED